MKLPTFKSLQSMTLALALIGPMGQALAAGKIGAVDAQYEKDPQVCVATQGSVESGEACLREADAVRQTALRGSLSNDTSNAELRRNALSRCDVHQDPGDRATCQRMVDGEGASQGSVESGGIVREAITLIEPSSPTESSAMPVKLLGPWHVVSRFARRGIAIRSVGSALRKPLFALSKKLVSASGEQAPCAWGVVAWSRCLRLNGLP